MFRSATIYQLTIPAQALVGRLQAAMESPEAQFAPPLEYQPIARGFVPPLGADTEDMLYTANGGLLMCLRTDEKAVPASYLKQQVVQRRAAAESEGSEFTKVDERLAREEITEQLLPGIPPATTLHYAYLDQQLAMLFVGATGDAAEGFTEQLGKALGGAAPLTLLGTEVDPCDKFTAWVKDPTLLGGDLFLGDQGELKHPGMEGGCGIINVKREELESSEITALIDAGRQVCSVALDHEQLHFRLTADLGLRNLRLTDYAKAEAADDDGQVATPDEFAAMVVAIREVMDALAVLLGGWPTQEVLDLEGAA